MKHQWMWDQPSLAAALADRGFKNIRNCKYAEWADERFVAVNSEARHEQSICLEATK